MNILRFFNRLIIVLIIGISGCSYAPPDFPKTKHCSVTVFRDSQPVADVFVTLTPTESGGMWTVSGKTDAHGVAVLRTFQGTYVVQGAPEQTFKVTLEKQPVVEGEKSPKEIEKLGMIGIQKYHEEIAQKRAALPKIIPEILNQNSRTPILFDLTKEHSLQIELNDYPMDPPQKKVLSIGGQTL
ncbi:MAG: hypothetical protein LBC02_12090 [Planctomycetaceae bacterium]|jgi:hypothetical protein|nr:hypothetical protein [Planctomycetaceae bacterium]